MKNYRVTGWYRYSDGDEKDIVSEDVQAESSAEAVMIFEKMYNRRFFSIITEIV